MTDGSDDLHVFGSTKRPGGGIIHLTQVNGAWVLDALTLPPPEGSDNGLLVAVDTDDSIWLSYERWSIWNPCYFECTKPRSRFERRYVINNVGGTWSEPMPISSQVRDGADMAVHNGVVMFAYSVYREGEDHLWYLRRVGDDVATDDPWEFYEVGIGSGPQLAVDGTGYPWIAFSALDGTDSLAILAEDYGYTIEPIPAADSEESYLVELLVDPSNRPMVIVTGYEEGVGYPTYATARGGNMDWTEERLIAPDFVQGVTSGPDGALHTVYALTDTDSDDGLWYSHVGNGDVAPRLIDQSTRSVEDAPNPPQTLAVDAQGRPHIIFSIAYDEGREGLWYAFGDR